MKNIPNNTIIAVFMMTLLGQLLWAENCQAVPAPYDLLHTLTQPDGTTFSARQWGDEWMNGWETVNGYTIIQNPQSCWNYAVLDISGQLIPSALIVGKVEPTILGLLKHLRPSEIIRERTYSYIRTIREAMHFTPATGSVNLPVILIEFNDNNRRWKIPVADFNTLLFSTGTNSLKDYYQEVSYGKLTVSGNVLGWYTAANNHDYYGQPLPNQPKKDMHADELVSEAINKAKADPTVNFADYDADGDCYVDTVMIVHQGHGQETSPDVNDIWSHKGWLGAALEVTTNSSCKSDPSKLIKVNEYTIQPELAPDGGQSTVGVFAHEFGHALGLPDLYDTDEALGKLSRGVGDWSLMSSGSYCKNSRSGDCPCHLDAWSKAVLGWVTPTQVHGVLNNETIQASATNADVYQFLTGVPGKSGEYFLVENRQKIGFDAGLPGSGLAIWHIDESMGSFSSNTNCVNYDHKFS